MPFVRKLNHDFLIKNQSIVLSDDYFNNHHQYFKKITATRLSGVLGINKYRSPFQTWCTMVGIYKEEMDPILAKAGVVIEPKLRDYVKKVTHLNYQSYEPSKVHWDIFPSHPVFGGIPDGEPIDENGKLLYDQNKRLLEIKTSSIDKLVYETVNGNLRMKIDTNGLPIVKEKGAKRLEWFDKNKNLVIPQEYLLQIALYAYLRNIEHAYLAVTFLKPEDYQFPEKYTTEDHEVYLVEVDIDLKMIIPLLKKAENWYLKYIKNQKTSPKITPNDMIWLKKELKL